MDTKLYPLKFRPLVKETIWGGNQIASFFSRKQDPAIHSCGETWEVSSFPENITVVDNGPLQRIPLDVLCRRHTKAVLGAHCANNNQTLFPLLVKYLSTKQWLSIQVHPDEQIATQLDSARGKAEIWFILHSQPNSSIYLGVQPDWFGQNPQKLLDQGDNIIHCLNEYPVHPGDVFFVPAGQVHAMGENILALEIQQNSDTTYRIYDWNRHRPLQREQALPCISMHPYKMPLKIPTSTMQQGITPVFSCEYFACNRLFCLRQTPLYRNFSKWDHFVIWSHIQGETLDIIYDQSACVRIHPGDTVLLPACVNEVELIAQKQDCVLIESYIPQSPFAFDL